MSSERAVPFASKPPEGWDDHVEAMRTTRMFLLQTQGPTRFVVRGEQSDRKFTVLVGSRARCSCGVTLCLHHLFIMLKVLKVPPSSPLAWQTALIDSEVDCILAGGNAGGSKGRARGSTTGTVGNDAVSPRQRREFLRRGTGRTSAGGGVSGSKAREGDPDAGSDGAGSWAIRRLEIVPGEVCPVCQEEMEEEDKSEGGVGVGGVSTADVVEGRLTYCREGCGNNMHARCMLMYAEHRRSSGEKPCCPLCRVDWGSAAVRALREDARPHPRGKSSRRHLGRKGDCSGDAAAAVGRARLIPVTCRSCSVKVQAAFFRCLVCAPAGSWDLCRRCYAMSGLRRSNLRGNNDSGSCLPVGKHRHFFVQGEAASDPPEWKPADPPDRGRRAASTATARVLSLQGREITTADFELLLSLDESPVAPLHEHLLQALPPCDAKAVLDDTEFTPTPLTAHPRQPELATITNNSAGRRLASVGCLPRPSVADGDAVDHSQSGCRGEGGISDADNGRGHFSEVAPSANSELTSEVREQATVVAAMVSRQPSAIVQPSAPRALVVAAAASAQSSGPAVGVAPRNEPQPVTQGEPAAVSTSALTISPTPSILSSETAPVSGSFISAPEKCICCSGVDAIGDASRRAGTNGDDVNHTNGSIGAGGVSSATGRQHPATSHSSHSSSSPTPPSQAPHRRLPCGHVAHEACLIPLILESIGAGDPSRCLCPVDSFPLFPALSRHRRTSRRRRPGSDSGTSTGNTGSTAGDDGRRGTRSASSATAASPANRIDSGVVDRHARAKATRGLLRKNSLSGFSGGGANAPDVLGIALFGSGLAQPPLPLPPSAARHPTTAISLEGSHIGAVGGDGIRTLPVCEGGLARRRTRVNGRKEDGNGIGRDGARRRRGSDGLCAESDTAPTRAGTICGNSRLDSTELLLGEGMVNEPGGTSCNNQAEDGAECRGGSESPSQRQERRKNPSVVRGSTIRKGGGDGGDGSRVDGQGSHGMRYRSSCTGRARSNSEVCSLSVGRARGAAGAADGLEVTALPLSINMAGGTNGSRAAIEHSRYRVQRDEVDGRDNAKGEEQAGRRARGGLAPTGGDSPASTSAVGNSVVATDEAVQERPLAQPISVDGMALIAAVV